MNKIFTNTLWGAWGISIILAIFFVPTIFVIAIELVTRHIPVINHVVENVLGQ